MYIIFKQEKAKKQCFINWYLGEQSEETKLILENSIFEYTN